MPLPSYSPPALRSSRTPNPFDQSQPERLRILVDQPLMTGPTDGQGEYRGYPFIGNGSTGFPDSPSVLRSYFQHPALEVLRIADGLHDEGDVVVGEPHPQPEHDTLSVRVKTDTGTRYTGISYYSQATSEAVSMLERLHRSLTVVQSTYHQEPMHVHRKLRQT